MNNVKWKFYEYSKKVWQKLLDRIICQTFFYCIMIEMRKLHTSEARYWSIFNINISCIRNWRHNFLAIPTYFTAISHIFGKTYLQCKNLRNFLPKQNYFYWEKYAKYIVKNIWDVGWELGSFFKKFSSAFGNGVVFDLWWL
jgi:hypothetical protein